MKNEKGSALITVILVVLVLSVIGVAALVYMSVEDKVSGSDRLQKEALYAAEAGLRAGEVALGGQFNAGRSPNQLLGMATNGVATPGVTPGVPVFPASQTTAAYDAQHLGTYLYAFGLAAPLANQPLSYTTTNAGADTTRAFYSIYIRNNPEDINGAPTTDVDGRIQIASVGYLSDRRGGVLAVKIVAEGFSPASTHLGNQADLNAGATNAIEQQ